MTPPAPSRAPDDRESSRGQSLAEFALVVPVLMLILLIAVDFGRIYLGYINLQQMARVAAGFAAEHASSWDIPDSPDKAADRSKYQALIANEAALINCVLPDDGSGNVQVPDPAFPGGFEIGDPVQIQLDCQFGVLTPVISQIVGDQVRVSASSTYPVKEGAVASVPGGGGAPVSPPTADFVGSPQTGLSPLDVTFTDLSTGSPTSWTWNFGNGSAFGQGPHVRTYTCAGAPGDQCIFDVRLDVGNAGGFSTKDESNYITVIVPPDSGPIAEFEATPRAGEEPLSVNFAFVEVTTGVTYTDWEWDLDGDGVVDDTGQTASHNYPDPGTYDVTLTVTDSTGATHSQTKEVFIVVSEKICVVPDFANVRRNSAQGLWSGAGFTTTVNFLGGNGNYAINQQTLTGGTVNPQPDGCDSQITVGP
jgi:PKD repeat protein